MKTVFFWLCLFAVAGAEDLVTRSGKVYRNAVVDVSGPGLRVVHDGGVAKVPYADLTDSQREAYGLTEEKAEAAAAEAARAAEMRKGEMKKRKDAAAEEKRIASLPEWIVSGRIARILEDGSLVLLVTPQPYIPSSSLRRIGGGNRNERVLQVMYATEDVVVVTKPKVPKGGFAEGERWQASAVRLGTRTVDSQVLRVYQAREKGTK